ncbi:TPA: EsaB/YukD family protein [Listeria monocytogenes]
MENKHINVTVDFSEWQENTIYDLRIPAHQPVRQLIINLAETLGIGQLLAEHQRFVIKVVNKSIVVSDDDLLISHDIADGDILVIQA